MNPTAEMLAIKTKLAAMRRPEATFASIKETFQSLAAAKAWDAANPQLAAERVALLEELDRLEAEQERRDLEARHAEKVLRCLADSGLGERTASATENPQRTPAMERAKRFLTEKGPAWLVLAGGNGVGKTVAAAWILREWAKQGRSVAFRAAGELARLSMFDAGALEIARLKRVNLLVVDDFGAEHFSAYSKGILGELFDARHENLSARTIVTTNLKAAELRKHAGERVFDRWKHDGAIFVAEGKSMRAGEVVT